MSRKKQKLRRLLFLLFLALFAAVLFFRFGGGGREGYRIGKENRGTPSGENPHTAESAVPQSPPERQENAVSDLWVKLFPHGTAQETPPPAEPVPLEALAAWCARQNRLVSLQEGPVVKENAGLPPAKNGLSATGDEKTAGFPGVLVFRYLPPSEKDGFCALLLSYRTEPIPIAGRSSQEFCENVISRLDALADSDKQSYTRFYALDTDRAGPSQAEWLYETVKKRFPRILYTGLNTLNGDENDNP